MPAMLMAPQDLMKIQGWAQFLTQEQLVPAYFHRQLRALLHSVDTSIHFSDSRGYLNIRPVPFHQGHELVDLSTSKIRRKGGPCSSLDLFHKDTFIPHQSWSVISLLDEPNCLSSFK
jgi:hypothetical protein